MPKITYDFGLEGRLDFPGLDFLPINSAEELMSSDLFLAFVARTAQPFSRIFCQQALANLFGLARQRLGIGNVVIRNGCK